MDDDDGPSIAPDSMAVDGDKAINCHADGDSDDEEESAHFLKVLNAFLYYRQHSLAALRRKLAVAAGLSPAQQRLIPGYVPHIYQLRSAIMANYEVLRAIAAKAGEMFENRHPSAAGDQAVAAAVSPDDADNYEAGMSPVAAFNMDKLHSTVRQLVRDWSREGESERQQCYGPVLEELQRLWPPEIRASVRVLVPGAGLGRLAYDVARLGFECQGNEFSLFMLFVSNFILNYCKLADSHVVYPYVHQWANQSKYSDQLRSVRFPDICPTELPPDALFSMTAGDFTEVYARPEERGRWNAVVTVFFIDTAHNVLNYMDIIQALLHPGGYWINLGPLLYHFEDVDGETSIELPYEELLNAAKLLGFEMCSHQSALPASYTQNPHSMLQYQYRCAFTVFRKASEQSSPS